MGCLSTLYLPLALRDTHLISFFSSSSSSLQVIKKLRVFPDEYHIYEKQLHGKQSLL